MFRSSINQIYLRIGKNKSNQLSLFINTFQYSTLLKKNSSYLPITSSSSSSSSLILNNNTKKKNGLYQLTRCIHSDNNDNKLKPKMNISGYLATASGGIFLLFGKTKYLFAALKITKAAPLVSMVLTSFTYSIFFGWPYAIGMVGLLFFHECGHAIVMKKYGVPFSPMVFIPFMGAVISMKGIYLFNYLSICLN
jgi:hypothetical protein